MRTIRLCKFPCCPNCSNKPDCNLLLRKSHRKLTAVKAGSRLHKVVAELPWQNIWTISARYWALWRCMIIISPCSHKTIAKAQQNSFFRLFFHIGGSLKLATSYCPPFTLCLFTSLTKYKCIWENCAVFLYFIFLSTFRREFEIAEFVSSPFIFYLFISSAGHKLIPSSSPVFLRSIKLLNFVNFLSSATVLISDNVWPFAWRLASPIQSCYLRRVVCRTCELAQREENVKWRSDDAGPGPAELVNSV